MFKSYLKTKIYANENGDIRINGKIHKILSPTYRDSFFFYKDERYYVSKIVARCFPLICGDWVEGCEIIHLNGDLHDNRAENIKIIPPQQEETKKTKRGSLKQYKDTIIWCDANGNIFKMKNGHKEICKQYTNKGYKFISLKKKYIPVHRIIAFCFPKICGEWFEGCHIDHINTVRDDNRAINLRTCTAKENANNPITKKHQKTAQRGDSVMNAKSLAVFSTKNPNHRGVDRYSLDGEYICSYKCISDAERDLGVVPQKSHISKVCQGKIKTALGFKWKYSDEKKD